MKERPLGVVVISVWLIASALASIYAFFRLAGIMEEHQTFPLVSFPYATLPLVMFAILVVHLVSGAYLLLGQAWARRFYLFATPVVMLLLAVRPIYGSAPGTGLLLGVLVLTYAAALIVLFQSSTREFLAKGR